MDAFDSVRKAATELHDQLVSSGTNPLDPMQLVQGAIKARELELHWLQVDDPLLKGARALFDDQSGAVCCQDIGTPGERAVLVAHEIGHDVVHSGSVSCNETDIDASRSTETAAVGLQRVEDYGVRERRELQANVFAREFLFPASLARRLYLSEGLTATQIATRTGLPKNLVRQQLFDALLLPPPSSLPTRENTVAAPRPDPSQDRAAAHRGTAFQLQAGPGTGKTKTLVKAVLSLLNEGIHPSGILVLTFSNRAAGELVERIAAAAPDQAAQIWIGTFHSFGLDLTRRYHDKLGLPAEPHPFDRSDAIEVLQDILPTLPLVHYRNLWDPAMVLREIVTAISRAKDELADPVRYRALAQQMWEDANNDEEEQKAADKCLEVAQVYELYEQALRDRQAVDFGDLIMRPTLLLESDEAIRAAVQLRHRYVLVDEYQDVNHASTRMVKAVAGDGKRLWVVGDARQSIYRFRGASSANVAAFSENYPNAKADKLSVSYRSTKEIVDAVVSIASQMDASKGMLPLTLTADRGPGTAKPQIRRYDTLDDECAGIAGAVRDFESQGIAFRDQAVLCRTNNRLNEIAAALEARGIPVLHLGSLFEREDIRDLLALLGFVVEKFGDTLTRIAAMSRYNVSLQDVFLVTQWLRENERIGLEALKQLGTVPGLSQVGVAGFARFAGDLDGVRPENTPWEVLATYLLDRSDTVRSIATSTSITGQMQGVATWQFLNFVREQPSFGSGFPIQRMLDRVRQLVLLAEERDLRQVPAAALHLNAVKLMTVHGSKGLEFEVVHVPGLTVASFPSSYRGQRCPPPTGMVQGSENSVSEEAKQSHSREEECLFFVAVSRARSHFVLHLARKTKSGLNRGPSEYISWIPNQLINEISKPTIITLPAGTVRPGPIAVMRADGWHVTDGQLKLYDKCPRRYFYTHVLGLGSARKSTPFSRTHDCLYELISWLSETRLSADPTVDAAEVQFEEIWQQRGPVDHGFVADYRRLASRIIRALVNAGAGRRFRQAEPLAIDFPSGRVIVEPNEIVELPGGAVVLRRVRTGQKRSDEYDRLDYTLYHLAGQACFGANYQVEALHLTDETVEVVTITDRKLGNRRTRSGELVAGISAGDFPTNLDSITCPRCPHFFVCAAVPDGPIDLCKK